MTANATTLRDLFVTALNRFGNQLAVTSSGSSLSYSDLVVQANALAHRLHSHGIGPGVPVALMMSNSTEYVVADQAVLRLGGAKVPLNDLIGEREARHIVRDSKAIVAIVTPSQLVNALAALDDDESALRRVIVVGPDLPQHEGVESWATAIGSGTQAPPEVAVSPSDVGAIIYTGGTTGLPKGVVHTQLGLTLNVLAHIVEIGFGDDERLLLTSPLPHSSGFHLQAGMLKGAHAFVESAFDPAIVLDRIEEDRVTFLFAVPTMIYRLLDQVTETSSRRALDLSSLRTVLYGAAPITVERLTQGLKVFGPVFMQLYGQTEAPNFITRLTREDHDPEHSERLSSCGRPSMMAQIRIVGEDGSDRATGEVGEVVVRTAYTMTGYLGLPEKTAETLRGGWLFTGDLGRIDAEGYLYLVDRKTDMIISGGMNVYSNEVENVISELDEVAQVAVVGHPHPHWGESVVAFVVATPTSELTESSVRDHCRKHVSKYKVPKSVFFVNELPLTSVGKLDKKALRSL